jgi:glutamine amidotransferase
MITIVDYGVGNIGALLNMFDHLGIDAQTGSTPADIEAARRLVLPGIGAFDKAMQTLRDRHLLAPLNDAVLQRQTPVLGVCLGMQLLARRSQEGVLPGLAWLEADVIRITPPSGSGLKVPHIGWAEVQTRGTSGLLEQAATDDEAERFYFDHSYHMVCDQPEDVAGTFLYGADVCCAVQRGHVAGVQFHPEKSHRFGMRLLTNWARRTAT